jgi:hypothetical protein
LSLCKLLDADVVLNECLDVEEVFFLKHLVVCKQAIFILVKKLVDLFVDVCCDVFVQLFLRL